MIGTGAAAPPASAPRLLLILPTLTYRAEAFVDAATRLGIALTVASDAPGALESQQPAGMLALDFHDADRAADRVREFASRYPVHAVFGVDDDTAVLASAVAGALGLPHAPIGAVRAARDKHLQRVRLAAAGVPVPTFALHDIAESVEGIARSAPYPCVLKPVALSASRGVIRADTPDELRRAHARLAAILASPDVADRGLDLSDRYLVESFVTGVEVALEGLLIEGRLHVLALFDKPDPLDGPFFEETIYVTPSRLSETDQRAIADCAERAAAALGLGHGPVHAELRMNPDGVWLIELAARPIGGRCGAALRFGERGEITLEQLLLAHALGRVPPVPAREPAASGVMMIPTPAPGILREVRGLEAARAVPGITAVAITAHRGLRLVPLPEGSRYLGFIFARGATAAEVEGAIREAYGRVEVVVGL